MGGIFAALYLLKRGWQVDVFERIGVPLSGRGAGITTHDEMLRAITDVAGAVPEDFGVHFEWRETLDAAGSIIGRMQRAQIATSWTRMWQLLRGCLADTHYHAGREFVRYEEDAKGVTAIFADGARERGDVLIGADGFRSVVRGQFMPDSQPRYAGYVAWRGLIEEGTMAPPHARRLPQVHVPLAGRRAGDRLPGRWHRQRSAPRSPALECAVVPADRCRAAEATVHR